MKTVTSKENPVLKSAIKLQTRKGREEAGAFLVEGRKLISEAVAAGFELDCVFVNAGALLREDTTEGEWENEVAVSEKLFMQLAQTVNPLPHIAIVRSSHVKNKIVKAWDETGKKANGFAERILVLDRIGDPGNAGTMIRTALAASMDEAWFVKGTVDAFSDKVIRASAGAVFHLRIREGLTVADCVDRTSGIGAKLVVCDSNGKDLYRTEFQERFALVIGNEGSGPDKEFLNAADMVVGIPMAQASESLNAATAAAVVMYEALRQRACRTKEASM